MAGITPPSQGGMNRTSDARFQADYVSTTPHPDEPSGFPEGLNGEVGYSQDLYPALLFNNRFSVCTSSLASGLLRSTLGGHHPASDPLATAGKTRWPVLRPRSHLAPPSESGKTLRYRSVTF